MVYRTQKEQLEAMKQAKDSTMSQLFIGIDPGQTGALAMIDEKNEVIILEDYPKNEILLARLLKSIRFEYREHTITAALEDVHGVYIAKAAPRGQFSFGSNYGTWLMGLIMLEIPILSPTPRTWQKGVIKKAQDKKPALAAAGRLFPFAELYGPRGGGKDGRADALLIAHWCRRQSI